MNLIIKLHENITSWLENICDFSSSRNIPLLVIIVLAFCVIMRLQALQQRSPNFLDAGPNSRSYQRPRAGLVCVLKKNKNSRYNIHHVCVYSYSFTFLGNMFAVWLMKLLFCCTIVVIFGSMLDAAIPWVPCKSFYNCQITLTLQTLNAFFNLQMSQHFRKIM